MLDQHVTSLLSALVIIARDLYFQLFFLIFFLFLFPNGKLTPKIDQQLSLSLSLSLTHSHRRRAVVTFRFIHPTINIWVFHRQTAYYEQSLSLIKITSSFRVQIKKKSNCYSVFFFWLFLHGNTYHSSNKQTKTKKFSRITLYSKWLN